MNESSYKILQKKLNQYLSDYYEAESLDACLSEEEFLSDRSEREVTEPISPMCASVAPTFEKKPRSLDDVVEQVADTFSESLFRLIDQKGCDEVEVYKHAGISRQVFSKIRSNKDYMPKKNTALALCISLQLSLDETEDLLNKAGFALSQSSLSDLIVKFFIEEKVYDIGVINEALDDHKEPLL